MMKFLVDELPYYGDLCPFWMNDMCYASESECPRYWSKYKVGSEDNPHECEWLKEIECDGECDSKEQTNAVMDMLQIIARFVGDSECSTGRRNNEVN